MSRNKKQGFSKPMMVRMEHGMKEEIESIATANDLTSSDIIRMAVKRQLPALRSGRTTFKPA